MFRKMICTLISTVLIMSMVFTAFAWETSCYGDMNSVETEAIMSSDEILEQLNSLEFNREVEFSVSPHVSHNAKSADKDMLHFDSVEEFELYLRNIMALLSPIGIPAESADKPISAQDVYGIDPFGLTFQLLNTVRWRAPISNVSGYMNVRLSFTATDGIGGMTVSNIQVLDSWITGVGMATWTHRIGHASPNGGTRAWVQVSGTWTITASVVGVPIVTRWDETLSHTLCILS